MEDHTWDRMNREFKIGQQVKVDCCELLFEGTILGKSIDHIAKMWIVSVDKRLNEYMATIPDMAIVILATYID